MAEAATEFKLARVETDAGPLALVTIDNGADHTKPTTFGRSALESLARTLDEVETGDWAGLVVTGKPFVFAAGADIDQFADATADFARAGSRAGHELFTRVRDLPFPTLAAINGACLGGGVELALHCDFRTISGSVRHFGCPEVFLGIIPGWGGTQLLPRFVGTAAAIKLIVENPLRQNRLLDAAKVHELGLVHALFEPAEFLDESLAFLRARLREDTGAAAPEAPDADGASEAVRLARARLDEQVHGAAPAPYRALDLIDGASRWSLEEGYAAEEEALAELLPGRQAQASIYAYNLVERRARRSPDRPRAEPAKIRKVGIVGAGLMARQLAALFLRRLEVPVVMRDLDAATVEDAIGFVRDEIQASTARGRYDEGKARFLASLVSGSTSYDDFPGCDLVLEAVFEELGVKRQVFGELEGVVPPDCVLATNTSALSVTEIGTGLADPTRLVGMHFFNPVAMMPLVELVRTPETGDVALATAWDVAEKLRKRPVLVKDAPAFVVNRVLTRMTRTLFDALEHGNTVEETDEAVLRLGLPMAPSVLLQVVGPRVANHVLETLHEAYPDRFPLSPGLQSYAEGKEQVPVLHQRPRTIEEISDAALEAMAEEIALLLEEGVVAEAADVDTCLLLGAGFPFFLGGITKHLDATGVSERVLGGRLGDARRAVPA